MGREDPWKQLEVDMPMPEEQRELEYFKMCDEAWWKNRNKVQVFDSRFERARDHIIAQQEAFSCLQWEARRWNNGCPVVIDGTYRYGGITGGAGKMPTVPTHRLLRAIANLQTSYIANDEHRSAIIFGSRRWG